MQGFTTARVEPLLYDRHLVAFIHVVSTRSVNIAYLQALLLTTSVNRLQTQGFKGTKGCI